MHSAGKSVKDTRFLGQELLLQVQKLGEVRYCELDEAIVSPGDIDHVLTIILCGRAELFRQSGRKRRRLGIFKTAGQVVSVSGFFLRRANPLGAVVVEEDTKILCLSRDVVMTRLLPDAVFAKYFIADIADQHMAMVEFLSDGQELPALKRIARRLRELASGGSEVEITQADLAEMIGVTRITVSKVLGELEQGQVLKRNYGRIRILDQTQLDRLAA